VKCEKGSGSETECQSIVCSFWSWNVIFAQKAGISSGKWHGHASSPSLSPAGPSKMGEEARG